MLEGFKKRILDRKNIRLIRKSNFFDEKFYTTNNPKVFGDPCTHYYRYGWKEGYDPSVDFNVNKYLNSYLDVKDKCMEPLYHYLQYGKKENRKIYKSCGKMSFDDVFQKIYNYAYSFNIYYCEDKKRVNLFIDEVNKDTDELIRVMIKYCKKSPYTLRIVCDNLHELNVPEDVDVINYNSSNYLEVNFNDIYICSSWKYVFALLNTTAFYGNVYYYVRDIDSLVPTSLICCDDRVTLLVTDPNILKPIQKVRYEFESHHMDLLKLGEENYLYCDFGDAFTEGVEALNQLFLEQVLDMEKWKIFIFHDQDFVFHLDCGLCVESTRAFTTDCTLLIAAKDEEEEDMACITYERILEDYSFQYVNIHNNLFFKELDKDSPVPIKKNDFKLIEAIKKMKGDE